MNQPGKEVLLRPTSKLPPTRRSKLGVGIAWSRRGASGTPGRSRTSRAAGGIARRAERRRLPRLKQARSSGTVPSPAYDRPGPLLREQSAKNATFAAWWNSNRTAAEQMTDRLSREPAAGTRSSSAPASSAPTKACRSRWRVRPGRRGPARDRPDFRRGRRECPGSYSVSDDLMFVSEPSTWRGPSTHWDGAPAPVCGSHREQYPARRRPGLSQWMRRRWSRSGQRRRAADRARRDDGLNASSSSSVRLRLP